MKRLLLSVFLCLLISKCVLNVAVSSENQSYCSYLADKIYCYGSFGAVDMIALNVQNEEPINVGILSNNWEYMSGTNNNSGGHIMVPQVFTSPDRNKVYFYGGYNKTYESIITHPFSMFDAITNSWTILDPYDDFVENGTIVYGNQSAMIEGHNISTMYSQGSLNYFPFGFFNLTVFDLDTREWLGITNATNQDTEYFYEEQIPIYHSGSNSVYYIGGKKRHRVNSEQAPVRFRTISRLSISDYDWTTFSCLGEIPSVRYTQSLTLLPDGKTVLMFGGTNDYDDALEDSCYLLDLETVTWSVCKWDVPSSIVTARYRHSVVLVENNLFVIFGRETYNDLLDDMFIIDVSDTNNFKYASEYAYRLQVKAPENNSLSVGAIVGIVIGSVFAACLIAGVFVYRHRKGKKTESIHDFPADWDVIDQSFNNATLKQEPATLNEAIPRVKPSES
ncbi:hypothetical protein BDB01DRAFT_830555 [Pilobolus umbonatus]|nr:hypothetical protein BDB01DRAFT_830555 [Pilobolus umbonatus]